MGQSYYKIYIHLIWRTKNKEPLLQPENESVVSQIIRDKCHKFGYQWLAHGNTMDHLHLLVAMNPQTKISDFVAEVKGASSHQVNHYTGSLLYWQDGYGCVSVSESALENVKRYINNQKIHHQIGTGMVANLETAGE